MSCLCQQLTLLDSITFGGSGLVNGLALGATLVFHPNPPWGGLELLQLPYHGPVTGQWVVLGSFSTIR